MGIRNKLFVWISLTFIVTIGLLSSFIIPRIEQIVFDRTKKIMVSETGRAAKNLDGWFTQRGAILKSIALQMEIEQYDGDEQSLLKGLNFLANQFGDMFHHIFIGFNNKQHLSSRKTEFDFDPTTRSWYQDAQRENRLVVTEPYADIKTGQMALSIAYPVKTSIPGVIGTDLFMDDLRSLADTAILFPGAQVCLISKTGNLLYSTDDAFGTPGGNLPALENGLLRSWAEQMFVEKQGSCQFEIGGVAYYAVFAPVPTAEWTVIVSLPMSVFYEEQKKFIIYATVIALIGMLSLFLAIYTIIRQITKPLEAISLTAQTLGNGDLTVEFMGSGTAEVERLANSLGLMRSNLVSLLRQKDSMLEEAQSKNEEIAALYQQMKALNNELSIAYQEKKQAYEQTIKALADAIETKDYYTRGHSDRVRLYSEKIGRVLGWSEEQLKILRYAAILHDIGKIGVPSDILNKPGRLQSEEYEKVKSHPEQGHRILHNISYLSAVSTAVFQHHERIDGLGYPNGLKEWEISPIAKIIMVADTYDAMTSERPYRKALTSSEAVRELRLCSGTQFDSEIVEVFCEKVLPALADI